MCIVFLYLCREPNPDRYHLIIASNRDEFYFRPTASAKFWKEYPNIIAGIHNSAINVVAKVNRFSTEEHFSWQ